MNADIQDLTDFKFPTEEPDTQPRSQTPEEPDTQNLTSPKPEEPDTQNQTSPKPRHPRFDRLQIS